MSETLEERFNRIDKVVDEYNFRERMNNLTGSYKYNNEMFIISDIICSVNPKFDPEANHDVIYLHPEDENLKKLSDDQIHDLCVCGVHYDEDFGISMFC
tara:strand:+ start:1193 stop:1489 length:297 start_codon:yes stop_codon:yes gene_type:complete